MRREKWDEGMGGEWEAARVRPKAVEREERTWVISQWDRVVGRAERRAPRFVPGGEVEGGLAGMQELERETSPEPEMRTVIRQGRIA